VLALWISNGLNILFVVCLRPSLALFYVFLTTRVGEKFMEHFSFGRNENKNTSHDAFAALYNLETSI
jgi:hypothetical protein